MKKNKFQEQFLLELAKVPIVQIVCEKTGLSRNSIYRWRKEDKEFLKKMDEAYADGVAFVSDMSESQLLTLIKEKSFPALSFWLRHRNDNYKNKLEIVTKEDDGKLTPAQQKVVKQALRHASLTKSDSIKNSSKRKKHE